MAELPKIVTGLGKAELHRILVRGHDLTEELLGKITFTDMTGLPCSLSWWSTGWSPTW